MYISIEARVKAPVTLHLITIRQQYQKNRSPIKFMLAITLLRIVPV